MSPKAALKSSGPQPWTRRSIPWVGGLFICVIAATAVYDIVRSYRTAVVGTGQELDAQARVIAEQTARSVQAVDVLLRHIAEQFRVGTLSPLSAQDLSAYLQEQAVGLVQIDGLVMFHASGALRASSFAIPQQPQPINVSQFAVFQALRDDRRLGLYIDNATLSIDGLWVVPMGRRLESSSGEFAGVVGARGRIDYFQHFYRDVRLDEGTKVTLMQQSGTLLARHPPVEAALGKRFPLFDEMLALRKAGAPGPTHTVSPVDGVERFGALELVPGYPLAVIVTRDTATALAPWREQAVGTAIRTLALSVLAALLLAIVMRQFSRLHAARESLEVSQERYALAVAGSDGGIWDFDLAAGRVFGSARGREILGLPPGPETQTMEEWFGALEFHPDDAPRRLAAMNAHLAGEVPAYEGEFRVRKADGSFRWVRIHGVCVRDAGGKPYRMAGSVSDIDARKRAEEALRLSEERHALAMIGSNEGHWVWHTVKDELFASATMKELFGLPPDAQVSTWAAFFERITPHSDDLRGVRQAFHDHLSGRSPRLDLEHRVVQRGSGDIRWVHSRGQCFRDDDGKPVRIAGSTVDISERKRAEEALRQSEERYALAVAGSDDGVWDWDFAAGLAFESARARELQGLPPGPELQPLNDLVDSLRVHPDDAPRRAEGIRAHLAGETPHYECEYRVRHADGNYRWVRVHALCIRDAAGKPCRMAGSVSDIDARTRAEEARRHSEERFALAVAGSNDGIVDWDIVNNRMFTSPRAMHIAGVESEVTTRTREEWLALLKVHPDDAQRHNEDFRRHLEGETEVREGDYRVLQPDGAYRWVRVRGMSVRDATGRAIRWAGSVSDVDEQIRTEQALRQSDERYKLAVAGSNEGLWDWDLKRDMLFLSARAQTLMGLQPSEPLRPRREWIDRSTYHPDDLSRVRRAISAHLKGDTPHFEVEYRMRHPSGDWHWYRQRGVAVRDESGRPYRLAGSMEDISRRRHAEEERGRLETQLRQAQKLEAIGTLAGGIAHDFNNILSAILGYGEMAQKDAAAGTSLRRHIDAALSAGMRAKSLVERILAFSRSGMGERVPVHVQSVVEEALDLVCASLPPGVRVDRELSAGDAAVLGDPTQVHQVVMNLCANAVQAMKSSGVLTVSLDVATLGGSIAATSTLAAGSYVRLSVRDTGTGIAPHVLERIFDPFFTTKEIGVGTGLGLSLVHGIVTDLGGGIDVTSCVAEQLSPGRSEDSCSPQGPRSGPFGALGADAVSRGRGPTGQGSTFTVYLPWQGAAVAAPVSGEEDVPNGDGETILLVDDEEALVRLGEEMIAELGYEPVGFTSSEAALQSFRAAPERFNAVLSDEAMPGMTGSELAIEIRKIRPDIPIVLMSGFVTSALSARARDAGVIDVLSKPLAARDIARCLANALRAGATI